MKILQSITKLFVSKITLLLLLFLLFYTSVTAQNTGNQFGNSGNVGVGTNNPNFPLEVFGESRFHGKLGVDSVAIFSDTLIMMETARAEEDLIVNGDLILTQLKLEGFDPLRAVFVNADGIVVTLDDPCRQSSGTAPYWQYEPYQIFVDCPEGVRVGIGTSTPDHNLEVIGDQYLTGFLGIGSSDPFCRLDIKTSYGSDILAARYVNNTGGTTPTDNELFFVPRLSNAAIYNTMSSENDFGIFWSDNSHAGGILNENSGLVIGPHNYNLTNPGLKIGANGFIGIGNKAPSKRLEISKGALILSDDNGSDGDYRFLIQDNSSSNHFLHFSNANGSQMTVNNEGKLFVKEVEVTVSNLPPVPDYVFEQDYVLMSIDSISDFVKKNKHLPEVPNSLELNENGMNLGEMDLILLKKIEELTLYIIILNNEIEKQKTILDELSKTNN